MTLRTVLLFSLLCYLSHCERVEGIPKKLSLKEESEIEKELKRLNKPSLKTIKTQFGDVYDCIDFYKQPAFDHPLLKNHTYHHQMRAISFPTWNKEMKNSNEPSEIGLPDGGCPEGTVPIRRTTKEDLLRAKLSKQSNDGVQHRAAVRTKAVSFIKKYNGGSTSTSVYNPVVSEQQYSSSAMTLRNGLDSIEIGWTVNPSLYGDHRTRLYIDLKSPSSSCYNTDCPGFVIVNTRIPITSPLEPVSQRGGPIYSFDLYIFREENSGNWWVAVGNNYTEIGFWPQKIFGGLQDLGVYVEWGGLTYGPLDEGLPNMGSSILPTFDTNYDAFCANIKTVNEAHQIVDVGDTEPIVSDEKKYKVFDMGLGRGDYEHLVLFGGH